MEENKSAVSRRSFLVNGTAAMGALGLALGVGTGSLVNPTEAQAATPVPGLTDFPLPSIDIDVAKVRQYGFYCYQNYGGCGLGSARALLAGILDAHRLGGTDPKRWVDVPLNLYAWCNGGGPGGWGTLCGAIAGPNGVLNLMGLHGALGSKVFEWYTQQNFPLANLDDYEGTPVFPDLFPAEVTTPKAPLDDALVKGHAVTDSPLCHVSVSKWLAAANVKLGDKHTDNVRGLKEDRCAKVTGDTAAYAAFLINEYRAGRNPAAWGKPAAMAGCFDCHDPSGPATLTKKDAQTKMDCLPCHSEPTSGRK